MLSQMRLGKNVLRSLHTPLRAMSTQKLTEATINQKVLGAEYAVRGAIVLRGMQHEEALAKGEKRPFTKMVFCNVGNPQQLNQKPITFFRQLLALMDYPELIDNPPSVFPKDVVERARKIRARAPGGTGAYSESKGLKVLREDVVKFIETRDGVKADVEKIFLTDGASQGVNVALTLLIRDSNDSIMIPIPQYPLYTATIALLGGHYSPYYLNEENGWSMDISELERSAAQAKKDGKKLRALAVINPGNPTGQCLDEANMKEVVKFCEREGMVLLADEVYQQNVYGEGNTSMGLYDKDLRKSHGFISFRKVVADLKSSCQLMSFHSVSKGVVGECGRRGGYLELENIDPGVADQVLKLFSIGLCSNISGQVMVGAMVNPPKPGDESYELFKSEFDALYDSLKRRSQKLSKALNAMPNVSCTSIDGALYAFPSVHLPPKAVAAAEAKKMVPDAFFCMELLDATGICVVPGSGFKQKEGTFHFRTTFLPPEAEFDGVIERMSAFTKEFMAKYA
mmetsp:Transcript_27519/g.53681  ORF Transcript_27519/g.53681 Transcript_27519/m.53681 type:complete len:511 (-) Transcript_27519:89-1621(-)